MCPEAGRLIQAHECEFSPQPCVQWHYVGTLKSAMGGVFITLNLEKITSPRIFFYPKRARVLIQHWTYSFNQAAKKIKSTLKRKWKSMAQWTPDAGPNTQKKFTFLKISRE